MAKARSKARLKFVATGDKAIDAALAGLAPKLAKAALRKGLRRRAKVIQSAVVAEAPVGETRQLKGAIKVKAGKRTRKGTIAVNVTAGEGDFKGDTYYGTSRTGTEHVPPSGFMRRELRRRQGRGAARDRRGHRRRRPGRDRRPAAGKRPSGNRPCHSCRSATSSSPASPSPAPELAGGPRVVGGSEQGFDKLLGIETNVPAALAAPADVRSVMFLAGPGGGDVTLKFNSTASPTQTIVLKPGLPLVWQHDALYFANPITASFSGVYVTTTARAESGSDS